MSYGTKKTETRTISPSQRARGTTRIIKAPEGIEYYDLVKNWGKVEPHLSDPELNDVLAPQEKTHA